MKNTSNTRLLSSFLHIIKWTLLAALVAVLAGSASAFFLFALERATAARLAHHALLLLLPVAGFVVAYLYLHYGQQVEAGNNLLIDEIHNPKKIIPLRMVPLVLAATVTSHLFGASVGREGTAVQMGGALADQLNRAIGLAAEDRRIMLMAGISAGFASVFGTPLAGAIFGLEVLIIGRLRYEALLPCLIAAVLADQVGLFWGVQHTHYLITQIPPLSLRNLLMMIIAGACFGLCARLFATFTHRGSAWFTARIAYAPLRSFFGGCLILAIVWFGAAERYIGLGIPVIVEAFAQPVPVYDFAAKAMLTIASLSAGFKGGEVTPLFFIGATLGNALAPLLQLPFSLLAGMGFVAVFAGAANTPLASTLMAIELFGADVGVFAAIACAVSFLCSGHAGIYRAQGRGENQVGP
ncbi:MULTISPECIES: voltage-gated chloride channel family protein [unclassified Undibacterium]|uniref:voltage-gated chloride channel family protein n=1 Tax=unclassified Undibacterium TaxID=2630295 RepID=UPI002AC8E8D4|nr:MULTISPECIES: voltage-gated chloride channel family protein [unclassified Undibacterium]MEB0139503.1 voltage-gated chloride channel family protein [Undibacterium sp. CCC2.1]MEB0172388.1 voltage-gated chloride channel family protein [Undibacterium sp. CCC1.1]MEB0175715.1 voltage-gated chloride channel family protein [Undibacterium sp. CCC3.4]MEB0214503.1 voltage-gated chloride channel family protein [Undibacterium sp. 5I2]WPX42898.1 voltage-gated chloride channel family protein [Undibacteriu